MTSSHLSLLTPLHEATILEYDSRFDREIPQKKKKNFHQGLELYLKFYIFPLRAIDIFLAMRQRNHPGVVNSIFRPNSNHLRLMPKLNST